MESYLSWVSTLNDPWVSVNVVAAIVLASLLLAANYTNLAWFGHDPLAGLLQQKRQAHGGTTPGAHKDTHALAHQVEVLCQSSCRKRRDRPLLSACTGVNTATDTPAATDAHALELSPRTPPQEHHPVHHNYLGLLHQGCVSLHTPPAAAAHFLKPPTPTTCTVHTQTAAELLQQPLQLGSSKHAEDTLVASHEEPEGVVNPHRQISNSSSSSSSCSKCGGTGIAHACLHHAAAPVENGWQDTHASQFKLHSEEDGQVRRPSSGQCRVRSKRSSSSSSSNSRPASPSPAVQGAGQGWAHIHTPMFNAAPWDDEEEGVEGCTADEDHVLHTRPATALLLPRATLSTSFRDASPCRPGYCYQDLSGGRSNGGRPITKPTDINLDPSRSPKTINLNPSHSPKTINGDPRRSPGPSMPEHGCGGALAGNALERRDTSCQRGRSGSVRGFHGSVGRGCKVPHKESNRLESNQTDSTIMVGGATDAQMQGPGEEHLGEVGSGCESVSVRVHGNGSNGGGWRSSRSSSDSTSLQSQPPYSAQQQWQQLVGARSEKKRRREGTEVTGRGKGVGRQLFTEGAAASGHIGVMGSLGASGQHKIGDSDAEGCSATAAAGLAALSPVASALQPQAAEGDAAAAAAAGAAEILPAESAPPPPVPPGAAEGDGSGAQALFSDEAQLLQEVQVWQQRAMEAERRVHELQTEANSVLLQTGWLEEELAYRQEQEEASKVEATELQARLQRLETDHQQLLLQLTAQLGIQPSPLATPGAPSSPSLATGPCDPQPLTFSPGCDDALDTSSGGK